MTPAEVLARLDERFRLLTSGRRTVLERHQTLRAAIDWSYALLDPVEQLVFGRLAVFAGGFTLDAAEAVTSGEGVEHHDVLGHLASLVAKSMVVTDDTAAGTRYRLLDTLREYAWERLAEIDDASRMHARHADHFLALVETAAAPLRGADAEEWCFAPRRRAGQPPRCARLGPRSRPARVAGRPGPRARDLLVDARSPSAKPTSGTAPRSTTVHARAGGAGGAPRFRRPRRERDRPRRGEQRPVPGEPRVLPRRRPRAGADGAPVPRDHRTRIEPPRGGDRLLRRSSRRRTRARRRMGPGLRTLAARAVCTLGGEPDRGRMLADEALTAARHLGEAFLVSQALLTSGTARVESEPEVAVDAPPRVDRP